MKSHKNIQKEEVYRILEKKYPEKLLPFVDSLDIPNNWLKLHGYAMKKRAGRKCAWRKRKKLRNSRSTDWR